MAVKFQVKRGCNGTMFPVYGFAWILRLLSYFFFFLLLFLRRLIDFFFSFSFLVHWNFGNATLLVQIGYELNDLPHITWPTDLPAKTRTKSHTFWYCPLFNSKYMFNACEVWVFFYSFVASLKVVHNFSTVN